MNVSAHLLIQLCKCSFVFSMLSVELQMPTYMRHMFEVYDQLNLLIFDVTFIMFLIADYDLRFLFSKNLQTLIMLLT